jgi:hypothetical protein
METTLPTTAHHLLLCSSCHANWDKDMKKETPTVTLTKEDFGIHDPVDHPSHYLDRVPGIEAIDVTLHFNFNVGNAIKYLWRHGLKGDAVEDLRKAVWYIENEIERIKTYDLQD